MAKAYSRGLQLALGGGGQSPLRFAVMELRRMMDEMRRGDNMPTLSRLEWKRLRTATPEKSLEMVLEQAQTAHNQCESWAAELNIVVRALVASTTLGMGGFWDGVADGDVMRQGAEVTCSAYGDGHDWSYVRESHDGMMAMYRCKICGEEVVM